MLAAIVGLILPHILFDNGEAQSTGPGNMITDADRVTNGIALAIDIVRRKKWAAHLALFSRRHPSAPSIFHEAIVDEFWAPHQYGQVMAFRGGAKSTLGEEDIVIAALLKVYRNILIIGASEGRAVDRLAAITNELKNNDAIEQVFGQVIIRDTQTKVTTAYGCIQALGRDQDIRGIKHLDFRPDFVFVDDFEDKDNVSTPEGRNKTLNWFLAELLPACTPDRRVRVRATPMDAESVPMRLQNEAKWPTLTFPVEIINEAGLRQATWPAQFPLDWIDVEKRTYVRLGKMDIWNREYMCQAVSDSDRTFSKAMIRVNPRLKTWEACWAMIDPARTTNRNSATTGWCVWSWVQGRLVVWASGAERWKPDEIISHLFRIDEDFAPIWIGFEEDGLNDWALQPIRQEMLRRGISLPLKAIRAPRNKMEFIRGLQPFFASGEVEFATPQPALEEQLLNFPTGEIDAPNALAYAIPMAPGLSVYDSFSKDHIVENVFRERRACHLAMNAERARVTAVLLQHAHGRTRILADYVVEGDPALVAVDVIREAGLEAKGPLEIVLGPQHFEQWHSVGLAEAVRRLQQHPAAGTHPERGRDWLRDEFVRLTRGLPALQISTRARYVLNGLAGGYARGVTRRGELMAEPEPGLYRTLMEGLESCLGLLSLQVEDEGDAAYSFTADGRRYRRYDTGYARRDFG